MLRIANPMYDAVFKHLLEDEDAARLIVGTILGEEIDELEMLPQESSVRVEPLPDSPREADFTVNRVDFAATIRTARGERLRVLIEVQKSHFSDDIMRFRQYLGQSYADGRAYVTVQERGSERRQALPLLTIYFLGRRLPNTEATVLKVVRRYEDAVTGAELPAREDFVEALTHDCYVVQVPRLPDHRRNDLERLLAIFDQSLRTDDRHVLELDRDAVPEAYAPVLRRLQAAAADRVVATSMALEDEIVGEWTRLQNDAAEARDTLAETQERLTATQGTLTETQETLTEAQETIAEKDEALRRQQAEIDALRRQLESR